MKTCEEIQKSISDRLDSGTMDIPPEIEKHLKDCPDCRRFFEGVQLLRQELTSMPEIRPERGLPNEPDVIPWYRHSIRVPWPVAAAVLLAAAWGWLTPWSQNIGPEQPPAAIQQARFVQVITCEPVTAVSVEIPVTPKTERDSI
ncbi:MAG TPA: hypothetical protein PLF13_01995 [candidate division Zixibacteria bacterium]|nr:hypothetical protein [candidate division Zixibacteria bacterium]